MIKKIKQWFNGVFSEGTSVWEILGKLEQEQRWEILMKIWRVILASTYDLRGLGREEIIRWLCRKPTAPGLQEKKRPVCNNEHIETNGPCTRIEVEELLCAAEFQEHLKDHANFVARHPLSYCEAVFLHSSQAAQIELLQQVNPLMLVITTDEPGCLTGVYHLVPRPKTASRSQGKPDCDSLPDLGS